MNIIRYQSIKMRIMCIIILCIFMVTQAVLGYEGRGISRHVNNSHLRVEQAKANGTDGEIVNILGGMSEKHSANAASSDEPSIDDRNGIVPVFTEEIIRDGLHIKRSGRHEIEGGLAPGVQEITYYDPKQGCGLGAPFCLYNPHSAVVLDNGDIIISNTYSAQPPIRIDRDGNRSYFVNDENYASAIVKRYGDELILVGETGRMGIFDQHGKRRKEVQLNDEYEPGYKSGDLFISSVFVDNSGNIYTYNSVTGMLEIRNHDLVIQRSFHAGPPVGLRNDAGDIIGIRIEEGFTLKMVDCQTFNGGSRVIVTSEGQIVISHNASFWGDKCLQPSSILVFDSEGHLLRKGFSAAMEIIGMAIDQEDNLFIADRRSRQVYQISLRAGTIKRADIPVNPQYPENRQRLMALDVNPQGDLIVIEGDVEYADIKIIPHKQLNQISGGAEAFQRALPAANIQNLLPITSQPTDVDHQAITIEELDLLALKKPFSFVIQPIAMVSPIVVATGDIPDDIKRITEGVHISVNGRSSNAFSFMEENVDEFIFSPLIMRSGTVTLSFGRTRKALQEVEGLTSPTVDSADDETYRPGKRLSFISLMTAERRELLDFIRKAKPRDIVMLLRSQATYDDISDRQLRILRISHTMIHEAAHNYLRRLVQLGQLPVGYLEEKYNERFAHIVQRQFILALLDQCKSGDLNIPKILSFLQLELADVTLAIERLNQDIGLEANDFEEHMNLISKSDNGSVAGRPFAAADAIGRSLHDKVVTMEGNITEKQNTGDVFLVRKDINIVTLGLIAANIARTMPVSFIVTDEQIKVALVHMGVNEDSIILESPTIEQSLCAAAEKMSVQSIRLFYATAPDAPLLQNGSVEFGGNTIEVEPVEINVAILRQIQQRLSATSITVSDENVEAARKVYEYARRTFKRAL